MGLRKAKPVEAPEAPVAERRSMIASAARMTMSGDFWQAQLGLDAWQTQRFADESWQTEGWRYFDTNGQLHNSVDYIGAACSQIRIYVAHVDENGVRGKEVMDDPEIAALADNLFGGPATKAEMLRAMAMALTVAGECYIIGRSTATKDVWICAAPADVRRTGNTVYVQMGGGARAEYTVGRDIIIRVWTPHPQRTLLADSPVRAALGLLAEMQGLQDLLRAQINSRIANAVILPVPASLAEVRGDGAPVSNDDIYQQLFEVITANLEGRATAAQIAPILWQMPPEELAIMATMQPIRFDSVLSDQAIDLRKEASEKLAIAMNVPIEIQIGARDLNHWAIWWAGEEFIVKSVSPLMNRIVDALTQSWLVPALKKKGRDPKRYTYWYDTAPLAASANKLSDALNLNKDGIVSDETVRQAAAYNDTNRPSELESQRKFAKELMLRDPTLFAVPELRELVGFDFELEVMPGVETPPPPPPRPEELPSAPKPGQKPNRPAVTDKVTQGGELLASLVSPPSVTQVALSTAVLRALEVSGKRLLTPAYRTMFPDIPVSQYHTKIQVQGGEHADKIMLGAWEHLDGYLDGTGLTASAVRPALHAYVKGLLLNALPHNQVLLNRYLDQVGIV